MRDHYSSFDWIQLEGELQNDLINTKSIAWYHSWVQTLYRHIVKSLLSLHDLFLSHLWKISCITPSQFLSFDSLSPTRFTPRICLVKDMFSLWIAFPHLPSSLEKHTFSLLSEYCSCSSPFYSTAELTYAQSDWNCGCWAGEDASRFVPIKPTAIAIELSHASSQKELIFSLFFESFRVKCDFNVRSQCFSALQSYISSLCLDLPSKSCSVLRIFSVEIVCVDRVLQIAFSIH